MEMNDILNPPEETTPVETPEPVERPLSSKKQWEEKEQLARGNVRDPETGQYAPKAEETEQAVEVKPEVKPEPPKQEFTDKEKAFMRAAQEERAKRQELEKRLAALEAAKPTEPAKTFWDDPEAALAKQKEELKAESERMRNDAITQRINTSEFIARKAHTDFDAKVEVFTELLQNTPGLHAQWLNDPDPAEFAYRTAKSHTELKEAGSIEGLRERIEKEVRIKLEAELKDKAERLERERQAIPPSLSDARSKGNNKTIWSGPPPLDNILKGH